MINPYKYCRVKAWRSFQCSVFLLLSAAPFLLSGASPAFAILPNELGELPDWYWGDGFGSDPNASALAENIGPFGVSNNGEIVVGANLPYGDVQNLGFQASFSRLGGNVGPLRMVLPNQQGGGFNAAGPEWVWYMDNPLAPTRLQKFRGGSFAVNQSGHAAGYIGWYRPTSVNEEKDQGYMVKWNELSNGEHNDPVKVGEVVRNTYGEGGFRAVRLNSMNLAEFAVGFKSEYNDLTFDTEKVGFLANVAGNPIDTRFSVLFANGHGGQVPFETGDIVPRYINDDSYVAGHLTNESDGGKTRAFSCPFAYAQNRCRVTLLTGLDALHPSYSSNYSELRGIARSSCNQNVHATAVGFSSRYTEERPAVAFAADLTKYPTGYGEEFRTSSIFRLKSLNVVGQDDLGEARARSVNSFGHVVGFASDAGGVFHAVLWQKISKTSYAAPVKIIDIAKLPDGRPASAEWARIVIANSLTDSGYITAVGIKLPNIDPGGNLRGLKIGPVSRTTYCSFQPITIPTANKATAQICGNDC